MTAPDTQVTLQEDGIIKLQMISRGLIEYWRLCDPSKTKNREQAGMEAYEIGHTGSG